MTFGSAGTRRQEQQRQLLALSDERDWWLRRLLRAEKAGFRRGRAAGFAEGYQAACDEMEAQWQEIARPAARWRRSHADLEFLRWGPLGRERFGDPRPGDYTGGPAGWPDPEPSEPIGIKR